MSVLIIKGMKMPTDCTKCRFCDDETMFCWATREFISGFGHPKFCPLEEVPDLPKITDDEARFTLHQIGAYFSIKIRDGKEGNIPIELHEKVEELRRYIAKLESAQPCRCKDCAKRDYCRTSNTWAVPPNDDWFCADAERRTDEHID